MVFTTLRMLSLLSLQMLLLGTGVYSAFTLDKLPSPLAKPDGMKLIYLTLGKGTQNYKCQQGKWVSIGADARLEYEAPVKGQKGGRENRFIGRHFFQNEKPMFEISGVGTITVTKTNTAAAPNGKGVNWLQLDTVSGTFAKRVYRTNTNGGFAPTTACTAKSPPAKIAYTAVYSFWR